MIIYDFQKLHKELWDFIVQNPTQETHNWPHWENRGGDIPDCAYYCFSCEYAKLKSLEVKAILNPCIFCPLDIGDCNASFSLFASFREARSNKRFDIASKIAYEIKNADWSGDSLTIHTGDTYKMLKNFKEKENLEKII